MQYHRPSQGRKRPTPHVHFSQNHYGQMIRIEQDDQEYFGLVKIHTGYWLIAHWIPGTKQGDH